VAKAVQMNMQFLFLSKSPPLNVYSVYSNINS